MPPLRGSSFPSPRERRNGAYRCSAWESSSGSHPPAGPESTVDAGAGALVPREGPCVLDLPHRAARARVRRSLRGHRLHGQRTRQSCIRRPDRCALPGARHFDDRHKRPGLPAVRSPAGKIARRVGLNLDPAVKTAGGCRAPDPGIVGVPRQTPPQGEEGKKKTETKNPKELTDRQYGAGSHPSAALLSPRKVRCLRTGRTQSTPGHWPRSNTTYAGGA